LARTAPPEGADPHKVAQRRKEIADKVARDYLFQAHEKGGIDTEEFARAKAELALVTPRGGELVELIDFAQQLALLGSTRALRPVGTPVTFNRLRGFTRDPETQLWVETGPDQMKSWLFFPL
jgi:hypothetical protein